MHSLRLAYLRRVEDPYAARIITLDPSYHANPYIHSASLADPGRWPELNWPDSPDLSEEEDETKPGPSPRVRLNQIREERRARSASRATNIARPTTPALPAQQQDQPTESDIKNFVSGHAPVTEALSTSVHTVHTPQQYGIAWNEESNEEKKGSPEPVVHIQEATPVVAPKVIQFIPKFKGAAEMEARRRIRMAARRGPGAPPPPPPPPMPVKPLTFDSSSEEEVEEVVVEGTVSDDFEHVGNVPTHDISDEFDP